MLSQFGPKELIYVNAWYTCVFILPLNWNHRSIAIRHGTQKCDINVIDYMYVLLFQYRYIV